MSNEELIALIQAGDRALMHQLWEQVEQLVKWYANRMLRRLPPSAGVDFDDLYQCGYPALVRAVEGWDGSHGEATFASYYIRALSSEVATWTGHRGNARQNDPLKSAVSLDSPVGGDDPDLLLIDAMADPADPYEQAERDIYNQQLRSALDEAMGKLTGRMEETLRRYYYDGLTLTQAAETMGCSMQYCQQQKNAGLRKLRRDRRLEQFIDDRTDWIRPSGVRRFRETGMSSVEEIVLWRERMLELCESHS